MYSKQKQLIFSVATIAINEISLKHMKFEEKQDKSRAKRNSVMASKSVHSFNLDILARQII